MACRQSLRAIDMHGEVAVSEAEPVLAAKAAQCRNEVPGFARATPAAFLIGKIGQCINDRVYIRANLKT